MILTSHKLPFPNHGSGQLAAFLLQPSWLNFFSLHFTGQPYLAQGFIQRAQCQDPTPRANSLYSSLCFGGGREVKISTLYLKESL